MKDRTVMKISTALALVAVIWMMIIFPPGGRYYAEIVAYVPDDYGGIYKMGNTSIDREFDYTNWNIFDRDGKSMYMGPQFPEVYGYKKLADYRGHNVSFQISYHSLDDENWFPLLISDIEITNKTLGRYPELGRGVDFKREPHWWEDYISLPVALIIQIILFTIPFLIAILYTRFVKGDQI